MQGPNAPYPVDVFGGIVLPPPNCIVSPINGFSSDSTKKKYFNKNISPNNDGPFVINMVRNEL
jgi:hypothetical protein